MTTEPKAVMTETKKPGRATIFKTYICYGTSYKKVLELQHYGAATRGEAEQRIVWLEKLITLNPSTFTR